MEITDIGQSLSNETRVKLLRLVTDETGSAVKLHERYEAEYAEGKYRETIYRELENLTEAGLLSKEYNEDESQIEYEAKYEYLLVDLANGEVSPNDAD